MTQTVSSAREEGLHGFKEALRRAHEDRIRALEKQVEREIDDRIAERRRSVEIAVRAVRREQEERFARLVREKRSAVLAYARERMLQKFQAERDGGESEIRRRIRLLRSEDRLAYARLLAGLAEEALALVGRPAAVVVERGDVPLLPPRAMPGTLWQGVEILGTDEEWGGGCRVLSGDRVIDNTLAARWEKLLPEFSTDLSRRLNERFAEIESGIAKL